MADPDFSNSDHPDRVLIDALLTAATAVEAAMAGIDGTTLGLAQQDMPRSVMSDKLKLAVIAADLHVITARAHAFDRSR